MSDAFKRVGHFKTIAEFRSHLQGLGVELPLDDRILSAQAGSPLAQSLTIGRPDTAQGRRFSVGNRWCIHPMEGWDGNPDGSPSAHTLRRWQRFGLSGAKLIWGGEAFAVQPDGRANPNQIYYRPENAKGVAELRQTLIDAHKERFGKTDDLFIGLQLTHSGRFCRPNDKKNLEPRIVYHHPVLDKKFHIAPTDDSVLISDDYIKRLIDNYIVAAQLAEKLGYDFVDVKHCHGYLGHEFLSAYTRPGKYGGDLRGRTQFMREIVQGIRATCPRLMIGVRLSLFDMPPHHPDATRGSGEKLGPGIPDDFASALPYAGFGCDRQDPLKIDLTEPVTLLKLMRDELKIELLNLTAGSPYYNPHIQRPAYFPPSDGYQPPEDPLVGCVRQIQAVRRIKEQVTDLPIVGTAYTYFQEYLPHVAQPVVRQNWVDFVGVGRLVLSYPDLPADCLEAGALRSAKLLCRTFSDCTTAPRSGIISGCFPLDDYYKDAPENQELKAAKQALRQKLKVLNQTRT